MNTKINTRYVYAKSENVVSRDIQGELIIVPITAGIADKDDEIFTLNETGRSIWDKIDGKRRLKDIAKILSAEYDGDVEEIQKDTLGIAQELFKRKMLVEVK